MDNSPNDVIFEYFQAGNAIKVTAVDVATGVEATVVTPKKLSEPQRKLIALQKLHYVLGRKIL